VDVSGCVLSYCFKAGSRLEAFGASSKKSVEWFDTSAVGPNNDVRTTSNMVRAPLARVALRNSPS
jgi:hypothetical protein